MSALTPQEIHDALLELTDRIEACGASPNLTYAVVLSSELRYAIGCAGLLPDAGSQGRVRALLKRACRDYIRARS